MKSQKEVTYNAVINVLGSVTAGTDVAAVITKDERKQVIDYIFTECKNGDVAFKDTQANADKLSDDTKLRAYASSLVNNYLRKDLRLNGGEPYKRSGVTRATGARDPQLKAMNALLEQQQLDPDANAENIINLQIAIAEKQAEIVAARNAKKTPVIDYDAIPDDVLKVMGLPVKEASVAAASSDDVSE